MTSIVLLGALAIGRLKQSYNSETKQSINKLGLTANILQKIGSSTYQTISWEHKEADKNISLRMNYLLECGDIASEYKSLQSPCKEVHIPACPNPKNPMRHSEWIKLFSLPIS